MELVEKWEQSGLLDGLYEKKHLAQTLESAALYMLNKAETSEYPYTTAAAITFPAIRRVLADRNFSFEELGSKSDYNVVKEFVSTQITEENEADVCKNISENISQKLKSYKNLKVHGVRTDVMKNGFEIQFLCS